MLIIMLHTYLCRTVSLSACGAHCSIFYTFWSCETLSHYIDWKMGEKFSSLIDRRFGGSCCSCLALFCCPPCPSQIAAKLAFRPPEPTYSIRNVVRGNGEPAVTSDYELTLIAMTPGGKDIKLTGTLGSRVKVTMSEPIGKGVTIAMMLVKKGITATEHCILYSHGNARDLGEKMADYTDLSTKLSCDIFSYDYPGYGASTGEPSVKLLNKSIEVAYKTMTVIFGYDSSKIILYGESIGTVPTMDLASKHRVAGVILQAPLLSAMRLVCRADKDRYCCDVLDSSAKIEKIHAPVLVIQGTHDEIIHCTHGKLIHKKSRNKVTPLFIEGCDHNSCHIYPEYLPRLRQFINCELNKNE